jgi:hypothetical protein
LRLDSSEAYYADSAAEMTDNYTVDHENLLEHADGSYFAASNPLDGADDLSLAYLGSYTYSTGDRLDAWDGTYAADATRLHDTVGYGNVIYGRQATGSDGATYLQYWMFYYYNDHPFDNHEGDWEMVQYKLDSAGRPVEAAYSQHDGGERCVWTHVQRLSSGHPIVYVAAGSHASYFSGGTHLWDAGAYGDNTDGSAQLIPFLTNITTEPAWLDWPGPWGGTNPSGGIGGSPTGPKHHASYTDPATWEAGVSSCTEGQTYFDLASAQSPGRITGAPPPIPVLTVRAAPKRVSVIYAFKSWPTGPRHPFEIDASLKTMSPTTPAVTQRVLLRHRRGTIVLDPRPLGSKTYHVLVRVIARSGIRSRPILVPLK